MKLTLVATVAIAVQQTQAFVPPCARVPQHRRTVLSSTTDEGKVYVASEVAPEGQKTSFEKRFSDTGVATYEQTKTESDQNMASRDRNYRGLIDGDAFDGGDGQNGCVGETDNKMDTFEENEVITSSASKIKGEVMVTESKQRQMNAWGANSGYAKALEEAGMKSVDEESGEDKLKVRRQQFENYRNQQELQSQQRARIGQLEAITGDATGSGWKKGAGKSYMDALASGVGVKDDETKWNVYKPKAADVKSDGSAWKEIQLKGTEKLTGTVMIQSSSGRTAAETIQVKNTVMSFEPFHCEILGENTDGFSVDPKTGTLNRRSGEPIPVTVTFKSKGPGDHRDVKLVIETEEDKFIYQIEGRTG